MTEAQKTPATTANGAPPPDPAAEAKARERKELGDAARREQQRVNQKRLDDAKRAQEEQARQKEIAELRARAARADEIEKKAKEDALGFLEERGITSRHVGERILKQGTADAKAEELTQRLAKLEAEREAERAERAERLKREEGEARFRDARKAFDASFEEVKKDTPLLSKLSEQRLLAEYKRTFDLAVQDPNVGPLVQAGAYTDAELLKATEERLREERTGALDDYDEEALDAALTKRRNKASSESKDGQQTSATGRQGEETASSRSAKSLTQADAGTTVGSWKPANWAALKDREQNAILVERLKKGLPCD